MTSTQTQEVMPSAMLDGNVSLGDVLYFIGAIVLVSVLVLISIKGKFSNWLIKK